jgi:hypothetical protein
MRGLSRRGTLKVKEGRVQKQRPWQLAPNYYSHEQIELVIDRRKPGWGYRHVLLPGGTSTDIIYQESCTSVHG